MNRSTSEIAEFVRELEADLYYGDVWQYDDLQIHYNKIYKIIEHLMELTFQEKDPDRKEELAKIEYKARQCYEHIKMRLQPMN